MRASNDRLQALLRGSAYRNWMELDLDSDIFTAADSFIMRATNPERVFVGAFREGEFLDVYVGDDRQMAGVIDDVEFTGDKDSERMSLTGRDRAALLLDNEADHLKAANLTLEELAKKLIKPSYGIRNIVLDNNANRKLLLGKKDRKSKAGTSRTAATGLFAKLPRGSTKVDPGQTIASIFDKHTKRLGITWWMTAQGDIFFGKPNYAQEPSFNFAYYTPRTASAQRFNNVLSYSVRRSMGERYSEIAVKGQGRPSAKGGVFGSSRATTQGAKFDATAKDDELIARGIERKLIIADNDCVDRAMAQRRADFEMGMRRMKGLTIELTVPGFRQNDRLFTIDTLATLKIETLGIDGTFWIVQRRFTEKFDQRRTQLTLHQPKVWLA
jgi:prophage tail gpP-like protein